VSGEANDGQSPTRRLRVLFVTRKWRPATGGMENYSHELTEMLESRSELTVRALPGRKNAMPPSAFSQVAFIARSFAFAAVSAGRFDVLHIGDLLLWPLALAGRIRSRRLRIVVSAHGTDIAYRLRPGVLPRLYSVYLRIGAACGRWFGVIANSSATATLCRAAGFVVADTIPLGVRARGESAAVPPTENYVLFVGRLVRRKGCSWFIRNVLPHLDEAVRLKVAGTEWDRDETEALNSDRVDFLGPVYGSSLAALRQRAIVVIVPNVTCEGRDFEGFGLTAVEAAADGGVVLASRLDGLVDAVIDGATGFLLAPEDGQAWARKIREIAAWPEQQRQAFVDRSRAEVAARFTWERVAEETLAVYSAPNTNSSSPQD
jgi:phosphatidylinositol alpha-1,6-mannosyltransferase